MNDPIKSQFELDVYKIAFDAAMRIFELTKSYPSEERFSLTDQIRRSSRSVCANLSEAWRKRRYPAAFICKLNDCESESSETQTWIQFSVKCGYLSKDEGKRVIDDVTDYLSKVTGIEGITCGNDLLQKIIETDHETYLMLSQEALKYTTWLKRLVEAKSEE